MDIRYEPDSDTEPDHFWTPMDSAGWEADAVRTHQILTLEE